MNHSKFEELACLSACGELEGDALRRLEEHLVSCARCRTYLQQLRQMQSFAQSASVDVSEQMLSESRRRLHDALVTIASRESFSDRVIDWVRELFVPTIGPRVRPAFRIAFGAVAMMAAGVMIGYGIFAPARSADEHAVYMRDTTDVPYLAANGNSGEAMPELAKGDTRAKNFQILHADEGDGVVEFVYESVTPVRVRGNLRDKNVQRVLARALVDENNDGVRLRAMNVIMMSQADPNQDGGAGEIQAALLTALRSDQNAAVRRQAVVALQQFSGDPVIQRAFATALVRDKNPGVRIAAVNALATATLAGRKIDKAALNDVRYTALNEKNIFIRNQSRNVIEEASQL